MRRHGYVWQRLAAMLGLLLLLSLPALALGASQELQGNPGPGGDRHLVPGPRGDGRRP